MAKILNNNGICAISFCLINIMKLTTIAKTKPKVAMMIGIFHSNFTEEIMRMNVAILVMMPMKYNKCFIGESPLGLCEN